MARVVMTLVVSAHLTGCGDERAGAPTTPTPVPAPPAVQGPALAGVVRGSATGARLTGALVRVVTGAAAGRETRTNADGQYHFDAFPQGRTLLRVNADAHLEQLFDITFDTTAGVRTADFTLPSWVGLSGIVIDVDSGAPIAGAEVRPLAGDRPSVPVVSTGATGAYRFDSLLAGDRNFEATAAGYYARRGGTNVNGTSRLNLELRRASSPFTFSGALGGGADSTAVFPFAMRRTGDLEVLVNWTGADNALMLQLFHPNAGMLNEVRGGPTQISLTRPLFASLRHEIRVTTLRPDTRIPFTVVITPKD